MARAVSRKKNGRIRYNVDWIVNLQLTLFEAMGDETESDLIALFSVVQYLVYIVSNPLIPLSNQQHSASLNNRAMVGRKLDNHFKISSSSPYSVDRVKTKNGSSEDAFTL